MRVLSDEQIERILIIKNAVLKRKEQNNMGYVYDEIKKYIPTFNCKTDSKLNKLIITIIDTCGNVKNNKINLKCPSCQCKFVTTYWYGDVFYRLFNGSNEQKEQEKKKFEKAELFINISPYGKEPNDKEYVCLGCGHEW